MPQQLIYTSAPRGLVAGRSGYCTVARSASMREALMLQLERFSYYQHLSLSGGRERPIFAYRVVDIRGSRFHVLTRIQDAALDFTGRTNFIAHHLVFTPEEIRQNATPAAILCKWQGWMTSWTQESKMLENENWSELATLVSGTNIPAQTWQRLSGDAVNGYSLLEARAGASFRVDGMTDEDILKLFAESLELLEVRDARRDFRASAWNYTFTTSIQEQDNPADFRWRCFHSDNPVANKFAATGCPELFTLRATKVTREEAAFARIGRQIPQFVVKPQDTRITEGQSVRFTAQAEGIPSPVYQWFSVDRTDDGHILTGETNSELVVSNPVLGVSRFMVSATNSAGTVRSNVATLNVNQKMRLTARADEASHRPVKPALYNVKTAEDIERDREYHRAMREQEAIQGRKRLTKILTISGLTMVVLVAGSIVFINKLKPKAISKRTDPSGMTNTVAISNLNQKSTNIITLSVPPKRTNNNQEGTNRILRDPLGLTNSSPKTK